MVSELDKIFEWQEYFRDLHHSGDWPLGSFLGNNDVLDEKIHPEYKLIKQETEEYTERFLIEKLKSLSCKQQEDIKSNLNAIVEKNKLILAPPVDKKIRRKRFALVAVVGGILASILLIYKIKHN